MVTLGRGLLTGPMMTYSAQQLTGLNRGLTVAAAVGTGIAGGVFFAFSTFVMPALHTLRAPEAIRAMQAINKAAPNPLFMLVLFGSALVGVVVAVRTVRGPQSSVTPLILAAAACYLVQIVLTAAYHVPHNNALALLDPNAPASAAAWSHYYTGWTLLNHVRTLASCAACLLYALALGVQGVSR